VKKGKEKKKKRKGIDRIANIGVMHTSLCREGEGTGATAPREEGKKKEEGYSFAALLYLPIGRGNWALQCLTFPFEHEE